MNERIRLFSAMLVLRRRDVCCDAFIGVPFCESDADIGVALQDLWRAVHTRMEKAAFNGWTLEHLSVNVLDGQAAKERARELGGNLESEKWAEILKGPLYTKLFPKGLNNG